MFLLDYCSSEYGAVGLNSGKKDLLYPQGEHIIATRKTVVRSQKEGGQVEEERDEPGEWYTDSETPSWILRALCEGPSTSETGNRQWQRGHRGTESDPAQLYKEIHGLILLNIEGDWVRFNQLLGVTASSFFDVAPKLVIAANFGSWGCSNTKTYTNINH